MPCTIPFVCSTEKLKIYIYNFVGNVTLYAQFAFYLNLLLEITLSLIHMHMKIAAAFNINQATPHPNSWIP